MKINLGFATVEIKTRVIMKKRQSRKDLIELGYIEAIKAYRKRYDTGLKDSKLYIDMVKSEMERKNRHARTSADH